MADKTNKTPTKVTDKKNTLSYQIHILKLATKKILDNQKAIMLEQQMQREREQKNQETLNTIMEFIANINMHYDYLRTKE